MAKDFVLLFFLRISTNLLMKLCLVSLSSNSRRGISMEDYIPGRARRFTSQKYYWKVKKKKKIGVGLYKVLLE